VCDGGAVSLAIDIWDDPDAVVTCRTWEDGVGESYVTMMLAPQGDHLRFSCTLPAGDPKTLWYCFVIECSGGIVRYLGAPQGRTGGEGAVYDHMPPSFQVTVYHPRPVRPSWYEDGIVYQIFPDRFRRGDDWKANAKVELEGHRHGPDRVLVQDWDRPPTYQKDDEGHITCWDFYGGTLRGITGELSRLREMGFTVIYLNPIFEAASNHRYDTGDYMRIDPLLGTEEDFRALCVEASSLGMHVILDGVFNHTGCDSRYFNKYGNYPGLGAYQSEESPYRSWYKIENDGKTYCSWWGVADLPDVEEEEPSYRRFMLGRDGVVRHWLRAGASGWRLDVADELPDDFIAAIKGAVLEERPNGLLIGEVWEDASNKVAYGKTRRYLLGDELDSAMDYPFRTALLDFLTNEIPADEVVERMLSLQENYPPEAFACALNLLGSHDRTRLLSVLGGCPDPSGMTEQERACYRLTEGQRGLAKSRLWLAALVQMTMPGVPCVYYGDEAGLEGLTDPCNRGTFPWGHEDADCETIYRNAMALRRTFPYLVNGTFEPLSCGDDVYGFIRRGTGEHSGESLVVFVNRSSSCEHDAYVRVQGDQVEDLVGGAQVTLEAGLAHVLLSPLGSAVLYFHGAERIAQAPERGAGILCHVTSLPGGRDGHGTLGAEARHFVDQLASCGLTYWQVLPVNPTDEHGSPYAGVSAMAGNVNLLEEDEAALRAGFARFDETDHDYRSFCEANAGWLDPYACFAAIHAARDDEPWQEWPLDLRHYDSELAVDPRFAREVRFRRFCQYRFEREWQDLHAYAHDHGVHIIGDMPMYVSADSADVWANPDLFRLDDAGLASEQAGTPPDAFAADGQLWGNPTYDWKVMATDGYSWWLDRLRRAFSLYDYVRLDHFLGFSSYYAIEEGKTAREGRWLPGPGMALFEAAYERLGRLPVIAEDLGTITPAVRALVAQGGFTGMDVLEFSDADVLQGYVPSPGKVAYTSTHDTSTLLGWSELRYGVAGEEARTLADRLACSVWGSRASVVIMPLQDALALDDTARMNVPGTAEGNWSWQAEEGAFDGSVPFLSQITLESHRGPGRGPDQGPDEG
jgi:4-alpha-glucanotransferase